MKNNVYVYLYVYIWIILLYSGNLYNIIYQLYFNKILKKYQPCWNRKIKTNYGQRVTTSFYVQLKDN